MIKKFNEMNRGNICEFCDKRFDYVSKLHEHMKRNKDCFYRQELKILDNKIKQQNIEIDMLKKENQHLIETKVVNYTINNNNTNTINNNLIINNNNFSSHLPTLELNKNSSTFKNKFKKIKHKDVTGKIKNTVDFLNDNILKKNNVINYICTDKKNKVFTYMDTNYILQDDINAKKLISNIASPMQNEITNIMINEKDVEKKIELQNSLEKIELIKNDKTVENELFVEIMSHENSIEKFVEQSNKQLQYETMSFDNEGEIEYEF